MNRLFKRTLSQPLLFAGIALSAFVSINIVFIFYPAQQRNEASLSGLSRLKGGPARIVSLAPNITEILYALELSEEIVAVSSDSDRPAEAAQKKKVGTFWQPNTEAVIASKPDLVVTLQFEQQRTVAQSLRRLGYQVLSLKLERTDDLVRAVEKIGQAAGRKKKAAELISRLSSQLNNLKLNFSSKDKVKVLWVIQNKPLRLAGPDTFLNELIELAGGQNVIGPTIQQYPAIGTEVLMTCGAEVIIHSAMGNVDIDKQQQTAEKFWSKMTNLPAIKNNRIFVIESDTVLRLGPRLPQAVRQIGSLLHPDSTTEKK